MELIMDSNTYEFVLKKGKVIRVDAVIPKGCCGGMVFPTVEVGKPVKSELYHELSLDEVTVYVKRSIDFKDDRVKIILKKTLFINNLEVEGAKVGI
ncbi:hypothetical protein Amet_1092 [Alkaliphilus metalliredigens QYMF]|uniref:Uncharacterized protein n=1 Tax=Alkaliphilus metalliredigens (strain QYMF) TaxID=293826 RepID=A6TM86_ALKMQ|nr:CC/Se motif family (seleno)protein [Alkaliphilus metalliredigens]ABR47304.1 hypothetical protein Amet_1092 [Alkaliphilus metalliredigens QYMF]